MLNAKLDLMPESAPSLRSHVSVAGHTMRPLAAGALYWEDEDTLLVADLQLEKGAAFAALGMLLPPYDTRTTLERLSKAIRAVAKEKLGAELSGIDVAHIYAVTFGLGTACLAVAACLLIPTYYVNPHAGNAFVLIAFTIVVLGGMGSVAGALLGGLLVGVIESLCGLYLGESLGQIGIFVMFILVLLLRPSGLFGARA